MNMKTSKCENATFFQHIMAYTNFEKIVKRMCFWI